MLALASLLAVVAVSLLVTRVATVVLAATGLSRETARFQARSALTGTGFTTREAETVVGHPVRRRVVLLLMLLGNAGLVASASTLILGFRGGGLGGRGWRVLLLVAGLLVLVLVSRSRWIDRWSTRLIARLLGRFTALPRQDVGALLHLAGTYGVSELKVREGDWLTGRTLAELALRDEGVVVLGIDRAVDGWLGAPLRTTEIGPGDTLVLYGRGEALCELDERPAGAAGDEAHAAAVAAQRRVRQEQPA